MWKSEPGVIRYKNVRKHFRFINLVRLTICSANPQDMSHEIKFVRTFSLSSSMHKWRRMIIWQNWPIVLFGVSKFSPFRVKTKEFLILTLNRFICISAKKIGFTNLFVFVWREVKRLGSALARHTWQSEREAISHLWRRQGILLQRGNLAIPGNQEPAFPGPVIDGIIVKNRVIEVFFCQGFLARMSKCTFKTRPTKTKSSRPDGHTNLWNPLF